MAMTAKRLTPQPWASSNEAKEDTSDDKTRGWGVRAICSAMAASVPGFPAVVPCQKPRPGHACTPAITRRKTPIEAVMTRPISRPVHTASGRATSTPATT